MAMPIQVEARSRVTPIPSNALGGGVQVTFNVENYFDRYALLTSSRSPWTSSTTFSLSKWNPQGSIEVPCSRKAARKMIGLYLPLTRR